MQSINIFIHVVFGLIAIIVGIAPYLTKKGGKRHRLSSIYTSYSGYRVLKTKEKGFANIDFAMMILVLAVVVTYTIKMNQSNVLWDNSVVYYLLGYLYLLLAFDIVRYFIPKLVTIRNFWVYEHTYKLTGSFNALISAGAGTALHMYEPYNQIIPAIFTSFWLVFCLVYFPRRYNAKIRDNDEMDMNFLGLPKEGFGISNNAHGILGPKKFKKWLFSVEGDTTVELKMKY